MGDGSELLSGGAKEPWVLLVEDDPHTRESITYLLQDEEISLVTAAHGAAALELLRGGLLPRLILLDLTMPVMNGAELAIALQQDPRLASLPIILLSGVEDVHRQALQVRADGYLRKPVDPRLLLEVVRSYCA
jgi:CheY-like chemotaxis protein